ncbi:class I SAM-dependent methyltransferase [soil metagenome]
MIPKRVASRYSTRFYHHYARWKLQTDPLYDAVSGTLQHQPPFPILDIGCGIGLLAFYLRERGLSTPLHGMDFDPEKISMAQGVAQAYSPVPSFHHGDAHEPWPDCQGHVCLLDVLQYLDADNQHTLLEKAVSHVATEGLLIIRSGIHENNWRYRVTEFSDRLMNLIRLMKSPPIFYPTQHALEQTLALHGMHLRDCRPLYGRTPFNNYLLVFQRFDSGRTQR